jgi:myosin heavy subunit
LAQWRDQRNVTRDLSDIIAGQTNLKEDTAELAKQTVTKTLQALSPQEQADLARLAERQQKEAERMEQLHAKMAEMIDRLDKSDPATAGNLKDALEQARQNATAGRMKETARQIAENNVGQAAQEQQQILEKLQDLDALLRNRSDNDGEMLVKKLKQAEDEIEGLRKQQAELLQTVREAGEMPQPQEREQELARLQKQQRQLQQEVAQLARRLQRLQAQQPGESAQRAAGRMEQAEQQLQQGDQEQAAAQQQEALDDLEQAQRELAAERQAAEEQLVQQRLEKIADDLKSMIGRQQNVLDETRRLAEIHASKGNWTRAQLKSLRDLADVQRGLQHETSQLVEHLSAAEVFALALKGAARQMDLAAKLLSDKETGPATQRAEQAALQRFVDLVAALKLDTDEPQQAQQNPEQQKPPENKTGPAQDGIPMLSELKMLLTMQRELNARTQELAQKRDQEGELTPADAQELQALAQEQGALADLTRNITRLTPGDPEPGPEPETTDPPSQEKTE